ncbi:MAG: DNA (cytosine-5-)-methyltransferase [Ruminococcaceae bacterium]|nr:DNA (cytosine-5-)-methyltransferase [Oscillospiraceae bacterium]
MKVASLFSGIGGIDLGFKQAGFDIVWANERDTAACRTYRLNFSNNHLVENDIRNISANVLPDFDVIAAGFPCQSFSTAGFKKGFRDPRGNLFFEIIRIVKVKQPRIILLENVENIIEHDNQKTFLTIFNSLSECGYDVKYRTLQPFDYAGIPQRRKRVFIVAFRDIDDFDAFSFPKEMEEKQAIDRIIDFSQKQHTSYYYENNHPSYPELEQKAKIGQIYSLKNDGSVYCSGTLCPTLIAGMGKFPDRIPVVKDNYGIRRLTIRECLRFQGFPENFNISRDNSIEDAYKQIGNSVCVPIVNRIAIEIAKVLERKVL